MHPVFLHIGSFYIGTYGVMLAIALLLGAGMALNRAKRVGVSPETVMDLIFFSVVAGILGGRLAYILVNFGMFLDRPMALILSRTGFVFLGSVIGSLGVITYIVYKRKLNFWTLTDVLITAVPLGHMFGRLGCFFAGCCHGRLLNPDGFLSFLGLRFPPPVQIGEEYVGGMAFSTHHEMFAKLTNAGFSPAHLGDAVAENKMRALGFDPLALQFDPYATHSLDVWPVQLFESFGNILIFTALILLWKRRAFNGQIFLTYLTLYSVMRFSIEFLRGDAERGGFGMLSTSQWITLAGVAFVAFSWRKLMRSQNLEQLAAAEAALAERKKTHQHKKKKKHKSR